MTKVAVLTGDLINSTGVSSPKAFMQRLEFLLKSVKSIYGAKTTTFRGDGFQVSLAAPAQALECAIYLRAGLIAASPAKKDRWDARISVAIAEAASQEGTYGDAYIESGRGLDDMTKESLFIYGEPEVFRVSATLATLFVDDIISHWTPSEAEAYLVYLEQPGGHKGVAQKLKKSRSTITKTLLRARYTLIDQYLRDTTKIMELTHAC